MIVQYEEQPVTLASILYKHCADVKQHDDLIVVLTQAPSSWFTLSKRRGKITLRMVAIREGSLTDQEREVIIALEKDLKKYGFLAGELVVKCLVRHKV